VQEMIEALRGSAYKTPKGLRTELPCAESLDRNDFEELFAVMLRAGLIEIEEAEFEKDGKVIPFRKISLTDPGRDVRANTPLNLLFSDGIVEAFGASATAKENKKSRRAPSANSAEARTKERAAPIALAGESASVAARLKEWRAAEAKRLGVPAYVVLHDRTVNALAAARPASPHELLSIEGMGPSKIGRFGAAILELCRG
jgi:ATP-dependent DNA helicase RecQ